MRYDDDNPFSASLLYEGANDPWLTRETQQSALEEIQTQFCSYMRHALKDPDPWVGIRLMVNAERVMDAYVREGFYLLRPYQRELQADLHKVWRMERRRFIKRALLSPAHEFPAYVANCRDPELGLDGPDAIEDLDAVVRHLETRAPLNGDLRKRPRE